MREDFAVEMSGLHAVSIKKLDAHSVVWRRMYFWRNLVKTLWEIRKTIDTLNTVPEFRRVFKAQPAAIRRKFEAMVKKLAKDQNLVQKMRDSLGGHVLQHIVEQALDDMPTGRFAYIEAGRTLKKTHYRFAGDLVAEMFLAGVPEPQQQAEIERHFRTIAGLLPVFSLTDTILTMYADARKLAD